MEMDAGLLRSLRSSVLSRPYSVAVLAEYVMLLIVMGLTGSPISPHPSQASVGLEGAPSTDNANRFLLDLSQQRYLPRLLAT